MKRLIASLAVLALAVATASADENHYINTFVGDRAAGMAGAYTAIADGPEGAYYNPAGLAFAGSAYISLSTNAFQMKRTTYGDVVPEVDYTQTSTSFIPNFFGFVQRYPHATFAFTIFTSDNEVVEQRDRIDLPLDSGVIQHKTVNVDSLRTETEAGPTLSFLLGDRVSLGVSLFGGWRTSKLVNQNVDIIDEIDYNKVDTLYTRTDTVTVRPQIGIQFMPSDTISIGITTGSPIPVYQANESQQSTLNYYDTGAGYSLSTEVNPQTTQTSDILSDGLFAQTVIRNAIGIAWFASRSLLLSLDGYAYVPLNPRSVEDGSKKVFTWNAATGLEWYMTPNFPFRFGVFTNNANTPTVESSETGQATHVDLYGATISTGFSSSEFSLNLGGSVSYGVGKGQVISGSTDVQNVSVFGVTLFLSGGYQF